MRNVAENGGVEYGVERRCEMWWRTLTCNALENGYVKYGGLL